MVHCNYAEQKPEIVQKLCWTFLAHVLYSNWFYSHLSHVMRYVSCDIYGYVWVNNFPKIFLISVVSVTNGIEKNLIFKSNPRHPTLEIKSATLWIHITGAASKPLEQPHHGKGQLRLYKSYQTSGHGSREKEHFRSEPLKEAGWYTVEVTGIAKEWFSVQPKLDLSLDIAVKGTTSLEIGGVSSDGAPLQPFLAVETKEKQYSNRRKRQADSPDCPAPQACCKHDLVVNLDWDFVIAPKSLHIGACAGNCPLNKISLFGNERRAKALSLYNSAYLAQRPCCAPNRLDFVKLLAFDQNGDVKEYKLQNMKVLSCQCVVWQRDTWNVLWCYCNDEGQIAYLIQFR